MTDSINDTDPIRCIQCGLLIFRHEPASAFHEERLCDCELPCSAEDQPEYDFETTR